MDDQVLWRKAYDAYETKKNGIIFKDHPYVSKVRLLIQSYETMDPEKIKPHYLPSTRFYDVMNSVPFNKSKSLEEEFKDFSSYAELLELTDIREYGFPDVLDYEGDGAVVISWWEMDFKNKKWRDLRLMSGGIPDSYTSDSLSTNLFRILTLNFSNHPVNLKSLLTKATRDFLLRFNQNMTFKLPFFIKIYQHLPKKVS